MKSETFRWGNCIYDVTGMLRDIKAGTLHPIIMDWPAEAVKAYFELFLNPASNEPRPPLQVNLAYAHSLPVDRLNNPVILVHVGEGGIVAYEEPNDAPNHVIADGNHRVVLAATKGTGLRAFILTREQSARYELNNPGSLSHDI